MCIPVCIEWGDCVREYGGKIYIIIGSRGKADVGVCM